MKSSRDSKLSVNRATRKRSKSTLLEYIRSMRPSEELARSLEKVLEKRKHIRLRMGSREPFLARKPVGKSGLKDLPRKHDEHLYGKKRGRVAGLTLKETVRRKKMLKAAEATDRLREASVVPGWRGHARSESGGIERKSPSPGRPPLQDASVNCAGKATVMVTARVAEPYCSAMFVE